MASHPWTCRKCGTRHPSRIRQKCECGAKRPAARRPKHLSALDLPREVFVAINGGSENCGVCKCKPLPNRRHDRDHDHLSGEPRGILCPTCNGFLTARIGRSRRPLTAQFLRDCADYLDRVERNRKTALTAGIGGGTAHPRRRGATATGSGARP